MLEIRTEVRHLYNRASNNGSPGYDKKRTRARAHTHTHTHIYIYIYTGPLAEWVECSPMTRETGVESLVESYQRPKKWYLMPPCLTFSIIQYGSRVKWRNIEKGVVAIEKGCIWNESVHEEISIFFGIIYLFCSYICVCFQLVAFALLMEYWKHTRM